jgi:hypothetical protein
MAQEERERVALEEKTSLRGEDERGRPKEERKHSAKGEDHGRKRMGATTSRIGIKGERRSGVGSERVGRGEGGTWGRWVQGRFVTCSSS